MSESRILKYDEENKTVYYYYDSHEDDAITNDCDKQGRQYVTESVFDFLKKLIIHIPEDTVHTTRYYGFYSRISSHDLSNTQKLFAYTEVKVMKSNLFWRERLLQSYKYDPLICHCGTTMVLCPCYFPGYGKDG